MGQCGLLGGYAALIWPLKFCGRCDNEELFSCSFRLPVELGNLHESEGAKVRTVCTHYLKSPPIYQYIRRDIGILFKMI